MVNPKLFIFLYLLVFLLGTVLTTLLSVIALKEKSLFLKELRNFSMAFLLYGIFEFILWYFVQVSADNLAIAVVMVCSDACYFLFILGWVFTMETAFAEIKAVNRKLLAAITLLCGAVAEWIAIGNLTQGDDSSLILIQNHWQRYFVLGLDLSYSAFLLVLAVRYAIFGFKRRKEEKQKTIFLLLPLGLAFYLLWIMKWDYLLVTKQIVRGDDLTLTDPIVSIYVFVCVFAIYYVYKNNLAAFTTLQPQPALAMAQEPAAKTAGTGDESIDMAAGDGQIEAVVEQIEAAAEKIEDVDGQIEAADGQALKRKKEAATGVEEEQRFLSFAEQCGLTKREKEVLALVYEGLNSSAIAERLFISEYTVKRHLNNIFKKTGCKSRFELLAKKNANLL